MARIDVLPSIEIIRGLKGILDFYVWRGLPCVRAWPKYRPARQTAPSLAAALLFGAVVKAYNLLGQGALEAYRADAADHNRTARDIMVSGVYGNLHEASMSDFLTLLTDCRDFLSDLTALLDALHSIGTDDLDVHVHASVLPAGAATSAAQATQLTALQKIDDLQDALESKALDRLLVRGMDQLFSLKDQWWAKVLEADATAPDDELETPGVPAGQLFVLTHVLALNRDNVTTRLMLQATHNAAAYRLSSALAVPPWQSVTWQGWNVLDQGDTVKANFIGLVANDYIELYAGGFKMTLET